VRERNREGKKQKKLTNTHSFSSFLFIRRDAGSSKLDFDYLFLLYYIFYCYKHIIIRKYI
jgi:hypothetical protein